MRSLRWRERAVPVMGQFVVLLALAGTTAPHAIAAQTTAQARQQPSRPGSADERSAMVRELHERLASTVKRELRLSDAQAEKLKAANDRIDGRRRPMLQRERTLRLQLRTQLQRGDAADEREVASLLDGLIQVHRQRLDLLEAEQRELAQFLTPVQRARYFSLQENWRRHVEEEAQRDRGDRGRRSGSERAKPPA